jgi:hypothetical protein
MIYFKFFLWIEKNFEFYKFFIVIFIHQNSKNDFLPEINFYFFLLIQEFNAHTFANLVIFKVFARFVNKIEIFHHKFDAYVIKDIMNKKEFV